MNGPETSLSVCTETNQCLPLRVHRNVFRRSLYLAALEKPYPTKLREEYTVLLDFKPLRVSEQLNGLELHLELGKLFRVFGIERFIDGLVEIHEPLLKCLGGSFLEELVLLPFKKQGRHLRIGKNPLFLIQKVLLMRKSEVPCKPAASGIPMKRYSFSGFAESQPVFSLTQNRLTYGIICPRTCQIFGTFALKVQIAIETIGLLNETLNRRLISPP